MRQRKLCSKSFCSKASSIALNILTKQLFTTALSVTYSNRLKVCGNMPYLKFYPKSCSTKRTCSKNC
jgi:hypothetical protein